MKYLCAIDVQMLFGGYIMLSKKKKNLSDKTKNSISAKKLKTMKNSKIDKGKKVKNIKTKQVKENKVKILRKDKNLTAKKKNIKKLLNKPTKKIVKTKIKPVKGKPEEKYTKKTDINKEEKIQKKPTEKILKTKSSVAQKNIKSKVVKPSKDFPTIITKSVLRKLRPEKIAEEESFEEPLIKKVKASIKKKDLEKLRTILLKERQRLQSEVDQLDEVSKTKNDGEDVNFELPGYSIHLAEYATDSSIIETALMQRNIIEKRLRQVEDALRRIDKDDFGICLRCGGAISIERLIIKPFAEYCIECRKIVEAANRK